METERSVDKSGRTVVVVRGLGAGPASPFINVTQCMSLINRSRKQIYRLEKKGVLVDRSPDRTKLFLRDEVLQAIAAIDKRKQAASTSRFREIQSRHRSLKTDVTTPPPLRPQEGAA